jgi:hypothetical protein
MTLRKTLATTAVAALLAGPAAAQMMDGDYATEDQFITSYAETDHFEAWDQNDDMYLDHEEVATGLYTDWDADDDGQLTEAEFDQGVSDWFDGDGVIDDDFAEWDANDDGYIGEDEFATNWSDVEVTGWDNDGDGLYSEEEFGSTVYNTADVDGNYRIDIEEEGFFEGWFDGDNVEAEIERVGNLYD